MHAVGKHESSRGPRGLSPVTLAVAAVLLVGADWAYRQVGDSVFPGGVLDETAHALTMLLVLWALGRRVCERYMIPALIASVAIDLDHVPAQLGYYGLTAATPRPYTHSLLTIAVLLAVACLWRRRRDLFVGFALGVAVHFWRDLAESSAGVSLLWPWSHHAFTIPHRAYLVAIAALVTVCAARCVRARSARLARRPQEVVLES